MMIGIALIFPILTNVQFDEKLGKKVIDEKHPSHDPKDGICCFSRMKYFFLLAQTIVIELRTSNSQR